MSRKSQENLTLMNIKLLNTKLPQHKEGYQFLTYDFTCKTGILDLKINSSWKSLQNSFQYRRTF